MLNAGPDIDESFTIIKEVKLKEKKLRSIAYFINTAVISLIGFELLLTLTGRINADQLLLSSILSGLSVVISFKLLKKTLIHLYGLTETKRSQIKSEIDILAAINSHIQLKKQLQEYINGKSDEGFDAAHLCRDDQCDLGKWVHSQAREHFSENEKYQNLCSKHARFHSITSDVIRMVHENDRPAAMQLLHDEHKRASRELFMALSELNRLVEDKLIPA